MKGLTLLQPEENLDPGKFKSRFLCDLFKGSLK